MPDQSLADRRRTGAELQARLPKARFDPPQSSSRDGVVDGGFHTADLVANLGWIGAAVAAAIVAVTRLRKRRPSR